MLKIYILLFKMIESNNVLYCSWKNNHLLKKELMGEGDIDLLVHPQCKHLFEKILSDSGFIHVKGSISEYPCVYHYYGYDVEVNSFAHLHVYYKLVTGDSHLKNYRIPFESQILSSCYLNSLNIKEASINHQMQLYLIRKTIKQSSIIGMFLMYREKEDYDQEYEYIHEQLPKYDKSSVFFDLLGSSFNFKEKRVPLTTVLKLRVHMLAWHRGVGIESRIFQLSKRIINKFFSHKKKSLNGSIVAIVGLDGSGKTTAVEMTQKWLGKEFNAKTFHFGRPPSTFFTSPLRFALLVRKKIGKAKPVGSLGDTSKELSLGIIGKIRYTALAYERSVLMKKAHQYSLKGGIAILDRYPSSCIGLMDSPRISSEGSNNSISMALQKIESTLYRTMPPADLLFKFKVDVENALTRNRKRIKKDKETDEEIKMRFKLNKGLKYQALSLIEVDANSDLEQVHKQLRMETWKHILSTN